MRNRRWVLLLLSLALVLTAARFGRPVLHLALTRPATPEERLVLLGAPHHLLSPTGWHATPIWSSGSVHRWKDKTPVGPWYGYYRTEIAEGWVRSRFDLSGTRVTGYTFFRADGRILHQFVPGVPSRNSPPWLWGEVDLREDEMAVRGRGSPEPAPGDRVRDR